MFQSSNLLLASASSSGSSILTKSNISISCYCSNCSSSRYLTTTNKICLKSRVLAVGEPLVVPKVLADSSIAKISDSGMNVILAPLPKNMFFLVIYSTYLQTYYGTFEQSVLLPLLPYIRIIFWLYHLILFCYLRIID